MIFISSLPIRHDLISFFSPPLLNSFFTNKTIPYDIVYSFTLLICSQYNFSHARREKKWHSGKCTWCDDEKRFQITIGSYHSIKRSLSADTDSPFRTITCDFIAFAAHRVATAKLESIREEELAFWGDGWVQWNRFLFASLDSGFAFLINNWN